MARRRLLGLLLISYLPLLSYTLPAIDEAAYASSSIIYRDVCVIGGGSSGTYGAIRLRDEGKSVVVVEAQDRLGGHTQTYTDPATNETVDYGVVVYNNINVTKSYFGRFNIPLTLVLETPAPGEVTKYVDFRTGKAVAGYVPSDPSAALAAYGAQLAKYPYLEAGFDLPDPVPADLLLSFGDFVEKYSLQALVDFAINFAQGSGNLLSLPTLYVAKYIDLGVLQGLQSGFLTTTNHDNSAIYTAAQAELGQDVLLNSRIIATERNGDGAKILVQTPQGPKLIVAKKILLTIPPLLANLAGFDLSDSERDLFRQFRYNGYWTGLLRNTGIPDSVTVQNTGADDAYNQPVLPGLYGISPTIVPGLHDIKYGSPFYIPDAQVQANIFADVNRLKAAGTLNTTQPEFVVFSSHTPFELTVSVDAIEAGFYKQLYALQGERNTYYTGAAWHEYDSALLWQFFDDRLLPGLLASL